MNPDHAKLESLLRKLRNNCKITYDDFNQLSREIDASITALNLVKDNCAKFSIPKQALNPPSILKIRKKLRQTSKITRTNAKILFYSYPTFVSQALKRCLGQCFGLQPAVCNYAANEISTIEHKSSPHQIWFSRQVGHNYGLKAICNSAAYDMPTQAKSAPRKIFVRQSIVKPNSFTVLDINDIKPDADCFTTVRKKRARQWEQNMLARIDSESIRKNKFDRGFGNNVLETYVSQKFDQDKQQEAAAVKRFIAKFNHLKPDVETFSSSLKKTHVELLAAEKQFKPEERKKMKIQQRIQNDIHEEHTDSDADALCRLTNRLSDGSICLGDPVNRVFFQRLTEKQQMDSHRRFANLKKTVEKEKVLTRDRNLQIMLREPKIWRKKQVIKHEKKKARRAERRRLKIERGEDPDDEDSADSCDSEQENKKEDVPEVSKDIASASVKKDSNLGLAKLDASRGQKFDAIDKLTSSKVANDKKVSSKSASAKSLTLSPKCVTFAKSPRKAFAKSSGSIAENANVFELSAFSNSSFKSVNDFSNDGLPNMGACAAGAKRKVWATKVATHVKFQSPAKILKKKSDAPSTKIESDVQKKVSVAASIKSKSEVYTKTASLNCLESSPVASKNKSGKTVEPESLPEKTKTKFWAQKFSQYKLLALND